MNDATVNSTSRRGIVSKPFGLLDMVVCLLIVTSVSLYDVKLVFLGAQALAFAIVGLHVIANPNIVRGVIIGYLLWLGTFVFYGAMSLLWADSVNATAGTVTLSVVQVGLVAFCIMFYGVYTRHLDRILYAFVGAALVFCVRFFITVPVSAWGQAERFEDFGIFGANVPAMVMAYGSVILLWMCFFRENKIKRKVPALLCVFLFMMISILMGTRKSLLIFGVCLMLFLLGSAKNPIKLAGRVFLIIGAVVVAYLLLMNVPILYNSIGYRIESLFSFFEGGEADASTVSRTHHIESALQLFRQHPILGAGQDGYRYTTAILTYSHNNYVELLANLGALGFAVYYAVYIWLISAGCRIFKNNMLPLSLTISVLISDIGVVSYCTELSYVLLGIIFVGLILAKQTGSSRALGDLSVVADS